MGSGKTEAAIAYMNSRMDGCFMYITPYLAEGERIKQSCPDLDFYEPMRMKGSKVEHIRNLLKRGENIVTTHQAFRRYTPDMLDAIRDHHYTLIVDEELEVLQDASCSLGDIDILERAGVVRKTDIGFEVTDAPYTGTRLRDLYGMLLCNNYVVPGDCGAKTNIFYWSLPVSVINAFPEIIVLTYMFHCSEMKYFLDLNHIQYSFIGVAHDDGGYRLTDTVQPPPEYTKRLKSMVTVYGSEMANNVGKNKNALSVTWCDTHPDEIKSLKTKASSYFKYKCNSSERAMWSSYKKMQNKLNGKGYTKGYVPWNARAENKYAGKTCLAYLVNVFAHPDKVRYFATYGITYDQDGYALSNMVQWIWRSAIRNGEPITIYVPSRRMRELLEGWLNSFET